MVEAGRRGIHRIVVVGLAVAVTACHSVVSVRTFAAVVTPSAVAHRGSEVVAVTIVVAVVLVVVVVIPIDGHRAVRTVRSRAVGIPSVIRTPAPAIAETVVIPARGIVVESGPEGEAAGDRDRDPGGGQPAG